MSHYPWLSQNLTSTESVRPSICHFVTIFILISDRKKYKGINHSEQIRVLTAVSKEYIKLYAL